MRYKHILVNPQIRYATRFDIILLSIGLTPQIEIVQGNATVRMFLCLPEDQALTSAGYWVMICSTKISAYLAGSAELTTANVVLFRCY